MKYTFCKGGGTMEKDIRFIYKKEVWFISALINDERVDCEKTTNEIEKKLIDKLTNLTEADLQKIRWSPELIKQVIELGRNMSLKCEWVPFIDYFPYYNENTGLRFDTLGYFKVSIEYFKGDPAKKESIIPAQIQQIPTVALNILKEFCGKYVNQYLNIDRESPIFVFGVSDTIKNTQNKKIEIEWTEDNIQKYKKVLGPWTVIYSGQWPDYSDTLYIKRVKNNLSNRLSELHFIYRNSGFIYMAKENFENFFEQYMMDSVLEPTAQVRAMLFALISINESLDALFSIKDFMDLDTLEKKIENLRNTRGMIQTRMSLIYNELDFNRRQHYTSVLTHLIDQFNLKDILERIEGKFDVIQDSMDLRYQSVNHEIQTRTQRGMNYLNIIFIISVIVDVVSYILNIVTPFNIAFNATILIILAFILIYTTRAIIGGRRSAKKGKVRKTVDGVILDESKENIVLIKRTYPPFKNQWALPGGFVEKGESNREAVIREGKEETGLDLAVEGKIGIYDTPERDPRGRIVSTAFLCSIIGSTKVRPSDESKEVKYVPLTELKGVDLAFDHEQIIKDAVEKFLGKWPKSQRA